MRVSEAKYTLVLALALGAVAGALTACEVKVNDDTPTSVRRASAQLQKVQDGAVTCYRFAGTDGISCVVTR